jgi:hypothetical protein
MIILLVRRHDNLISDAVFAQSQYPTGLSKLDLNQETD